MTFDSLIFALFLPIVFSVYWLIYYPASKRLSDARRLWLQNFFVVAASYIFYGWWDWRFLILITFTALWSWCSGLVIEKSSSDCMRKSVVALALVVNFGILGIFKYYGFFAQSAAAVLSVFGFQAHFSSLSIILPVGISFYTFQARSYVIDVRRGDVRATRDPVAFLAFVSFFPQLVAGPIERAANLLPQFLRPRKFDYSLAADGCRQALWGFFKKIVVADGCADAANHLFGANAAHSSISLFAGLLAFSFQIYGDFSGYSDIAIGIAKLFGINLKRNFAFPYFSRNIGEFWRRWHISLTTWFKDYLYIPLGGSRGGLARTVRNTFIVFAVSGLWHGAKWTFVLWGLVHAVAFLPLILGKTNRRFSGGIVAEGRILPSLRECLQMASTFLIVTIGWAFFRAENALQAFLWLREIFFGFDFSLDSLRSAGLPNVVFWSAIMVACEWLNRREQYGFSRYPRNIVLRFAVYLMLIASVFTHSSGGSKFIYFQF